MPTNTPLNLSVKLNNILHCYLLFDVNQIKSFLVTKKSNADKQTTNSEDFIKKLKILLTNPMKQSRMANLKIFRFEVNKAFLIYIEKEI